LDIDYLHELLGYLKEATGFGVLLIDPDDPAEVGPDQRCIECPLCALVHSTEAGRENCGREFLRAGNEAKRWGEPYFYHCYLGLMEWAIPIVVENELVGILTCGQVLIQGKDDLFYESVLKQTRDFGLAEADVNLAIEGVPVVSGRKVRAAAELLRLVAERLSEHVILQLEEARSRQHQQAEIAEALVSRQECGSDFQESRRLQREIIGLVRIGDLPGARKILNDLLGSILFRSTTDLDRLKAEVLELVIMLSRAAVEAGAEIQQILGENLNLLGDLLARQSQEEISHWILKILENFTRSIFKTRNMERVKMISEGLEFIREHFSENITLDDVSKAVGRSSSYFKKILREEMGLSFTEYLTRTRLEASEALLRNPQLSLTEIAQMAGYSDQSYFGKIFKHYYGLTPAQYRKTVL
jgi:two-component system response regulator YesN